MGKVMRVSLKSIHRLSIVCVASAIVFVSALIGSATFVAAATDPQRSATPMPPCTRRVTIASKPCGARIYIDGMQVGRTPMSFPMPMGRYTLVLLAPGHHPYGQRILVPDASLEIQANLVPEK
jgi:hypothetical protein